VDQHFEEMKNFEKVNSLIKITPMLTLAIVTAGHMSKGCTLIQKIGENRKLKNKER